MRKKKTRPIWEKLHLDDSSFSAQQCVMIYVCYLCYMNYQWLLNTQISQFTPQKQKQRGEDAGSFL